MEARVLELLIAHPVQVPPTAEQLAALQVLADQLSAEGKGLAIFLAERLQGPVTRARLEELGCSDWHPEADVRQLGLLAAPNLTALVEAIAQRGDFEAAVRLVSWLRTSKEGEPLHDLVAKTIHAMLLQVEARTMDVVSHRDWKYQLANGWELDVFVRAYDFWRVDRVISPEGFVIDLIDFDDGPLAELNEYEPPSDIESEVYGLGYTPTRRWQ